MKIKKLIVAIAIGSMALSLSSCGDGALKKENEKLKAENDSLKKAITSNIDSTKGMRKIDTDPIGTSDATSYTNLFRSASTIKIPLSWEFDSDDLALLSTKGPKIKFYAAAKSTNDMTIIAVPVDNANNDLTNFMYDFAEPCPPKCSNHNAILYPNGAPETHIFNRAK